MHVCCSYARPDMRVQERRLLVYHGPVMSPFLRKDRRPLTACPKLPRSLRQQAEVSIKKVAEGPKSKGEANLLQAGWDLSGVFRSRFGLMKSFNRLLSELWVPVAWLAWSGRSNLSGLICRYMYRFKVMWSLVRIYLSLGCLIFI